MEDLYLGKVIYNPPMMQVDPKTRKSTGQLQKFIVTATTHGRGFRLAPYHGKERAEMPPDRGPLESGYN